MFMMATVASVCLLVVGASLVRLADRHRSDLWIVSEDGILCVVSPAMILLCTFAAVSLGWRLTHGGLAAVPLGGWIGSLAIAAVAFGAWRALARRIRETATTRPIAAAAPSGPAPAPG